MGALARGRATEKGHSRAETRRRRELLKAMIGRAGARKGNRKGTFSRRDAETQGTATGNDWAR